MTRSQAVSLLILFTFAFTCPAASYADELDVLSDQMRTHILSADDDVETALQLRDKLQEDGTWASVDYEDQTRGGWKTYAHLANLGAMVRLREQTDSEYAEDEALRAAIFLALDHWLAKDYRNPNWWYNDIGVPMALADIVFLINDELTPDQREKALAILRRATFAQTGQNSIWRAGITFVRALIEEDAALALQAREVILKDVVVTTAEGVQPDFSFHQHGPQQQFGNYGLSFASDMAQWAYVWRGTSFALSDEQLEVLRRYLIDGESWVVHGGTMDISSCGRQLFPGQPARKYNTLMGVFRLMEKVDPENADRYAAFQEGDWDPEPTEEDMASGRYFWRSDYLVHRSSDWFMSVKMNSTRTIGSETCNSENMQGYYLGDGATYFYQRGDEYEDIFPVWDWRSLPGVTCAWNDSPAPVPNVRDRNKSAFVGGLTNGHVSIAAMDYNRDGVKAKKAYFCVDGMVFFLGAGITSDRDEPILTSVNQCLLRGETYSLGNDLGAIYEPEDGEYDRLYVAHHDSIAYVFHNSPKARILHGPQHGTWKGIRTPMSDDVVTEEVFSLAIDHGVKPTDAKYAYCVIPGLEERSTATSIWQPWQYLMEKWLVNDASLQAYVGKDCAMLVIHEAGECDLYAYRNVHITTHHIIEVDRPCLVIMEWDDDQIDLVVSDPTQKEESIRITVDGDEHKIDFPQGGMAGSSVGISIPR
jgi:chondroitin AC lyase